MKFSNQHSRGFIVCLFVISQNFGPVLHSQRDGRGGSQAGVSGDSLWCPQLSEGPDLEGIAVWPGWAGKSLSFQRSPEVIWITSSFYRGWMLGSPQPSGCGDGRSRTPLRVPDFSLILAVKMLSVPPQNVSNSGQGFLPLYSLLHLLCQK